MMSNNAAAQNVLSCTNALGTANIVLGSASLNANIKNATGVFSIASATDNSPSMVIDRTNLVNTFGRGGYDTWLNTNVGNLYIDCDPSNLVVNARWMTYNSISH